MIFDYRCVESHFQKSIDFSIESYHCIFFAILLYRKVKIDGSRERKKRKGEAISWTKPATISWNQGEAWSGFLEREARWGGGGAWRRDPLERATSLFLRTAADTYSLTPSFLPAESWKSVTKGWKSLQCVITGLNSYYLDQLPTGLSSPFLSSLSLPPPPPPLTSLSKLSRTCLILI